MRSRAVVWIPVTIWVSQRRRIRTQDLAGTVEGGLMTVTHGTDALSGSYRRT